MAKVTIRGSRKYADYLRGHLAEEHPRTRGRIKVRNGAKRAKRGRARRRARVAHR